MSYCEIDDITREFAGVDFSASGAKVTEEDVENWIEEADAYIDSKLASVYTVPITGTQSLLVIKTISILIVSDRVERKLGVQTPSKELDNKGQSLSLYKRADKMLDDLQKETTVLSDATKGNSTDGVGSPAITSSCPPEVVFKKGRQQW